MNYEGLTACAAIIAIVSFHIGRRYEKYSHRRYSEAARRISQKYHAHKGSSERI